MPILLPSAVLLLLADARFPGGGHAHSAGVEQAIELGIISDEHTLSSYLSGRLQTAGLLAAATAALVCAQGDRDKLLRDKLLRDKLFWGDLDLELSARTPSTAQRSVSRRQGGQMLRVARTIWASGASASLTARMDRSGPHLQAAVGAIASDAGLGPDQAALLGAYLSVAGPATAAVRLIGLDPMAVTGVLAEIAELIDTVAGNAVEYAGLAASSLPSPAAPISDHLAETHNISKERLFAS